MTLCELEIAHLSPPMECRLVKQKPTAIPIERRHCVEWVPIPSTCLHTILMISNLERWLEAPSRGLVILGTSESRVSLVVLSRATALLILPSARMCYAYQQLNDIGMLAPIQQEVSESKRVFTDVAKGIYQNITGEKMRLVRFLLGREQSFQKNDQQLSASIEVRQSSEFFDLD